MCSQVMVHLHEDSVKPKQIRCKVQHCASQDESDKKTNCGRDNSISQQLCAVWMDSWTERCTYILIGGLVERDQVGVEAGQSHHWPQGEEAHKHLQHSKLKLRKQQQMFSAWHMVTD